jgi:DNA-binding GntR family transcriptional regulator
MTCLRPRLAGVELRSGVGPSRSLFLIIRRVGSTVRRPLEASVSSQLPATVAEYVRKAVRRGILDGRYALGSRLDQQALAVEYGASIIPVREGLRQLEAEGLVRIAPRRGAYVANVSVSELSEIYRIREVLEQLATRQATERMTNADLTALDDIGRELDSVADTDAWLRLNREWHFRLYKVAESPLLLQLVGLLWDRCSLYRHIYPRRAERRMASLADHRRIVQACRAGDVELAGQAIAAHIRRAADDFLSSALAGQVAEPTSRQA